MSKVNLGTVAKVVGGAVLAYGLYVVVKSAIITANEYLTEDIKDEEDSQGYTKLKIRPDMKMSDINDYFDGFEEK